jgi:hypothetical protein
MVEHVRRAQQDLRGGDGRWCPRVAHAIGQRAHACHTVDNTPDAHAYPTATGRTDSTLRTASAISRVDAENTEHVHIDGL